jgi:hypothetical protein
MSSTYRLVDSKGELLADADSIEYLKGLLATSSRAATRWMRSARNLCHRGIRQGDGASC